MRKELSEMTLEELWELFPILLKEYQSEYQEWFILEKDDIISHIDRKIIKRINHIGSTAVEGLISKPTVDILLEVDHHCDIKWLENTLKEIGWTLMSSQEEPEMKLSFNKGYTLYGFAEKVYHLHVRYYGDWDELYFRDYLREHQDVSIEYGKLKQSIWKEYEHNRDGYTEAKTDFVRKYSDIAREYYQGRYLPRV